MMKICLKLQPSKISNYLCFKSFKDNFQDFKVIKSENFINKIK